MGDCRRVRRGARVACGGAGQASIGSPFTSTALIVVFKRPQVRVANFASFARGDNHSAGDASPFLSHRDTVQLLVRAI